MFQKMCNQKKNSEAKNCIKNLQLQKSVNDHIPVLRSAMDTKHKIKVLRDFKTREI